jgi:hypothetical protein
VTSLWLFVPCLLPVGIVGTKAVHRVVAWQSRIASKTQDLITVFIVDRWRRGQYIVDCQGRVWPKRRGEKHGKKMSLQLAKATVLLGSHHRQSQITGNWLPSDSLTVTPDVIEMIRRCHESIHPCYGNE